MLGRRVFATSLASTVLLVASGQVGIASPARSPTPVAQPARLFYGSDSAAWQRDLRSGVERRLSPVTTRIGNPALSPDGQWLAYNAIAWPKEPHSEAIRQQLCLHSLADNRVEVALDDAPPETYRGEIAWTPDGQTLLYEFYEESSRRFSLRALDLATKQSRPLFTNASHPSISRIGQLAYLTYDDRRNTALWIADLDGRDARQIVPHAANFAITSPRLSPDGSQVVFTSPHPQGSPSYELWVAMADESGVRHLNLAPSDELGPCALHCNWSPNGQQIIFASATGIFRLSLTGSEPPQLISAVPNATGLFLTM